MKDLEKHPKNTRGHFICSKENPMPLEHKNRGRWEHADVSETDYDGDWYIEYKCNNCGHIFRSEMPD